MTPKEKAYAICLEYSNALHDRGNITEQVKQCALIAFDEKIKSLEELDIIYSNTGCDNVWAYQSDINDMIEDLEQVKEEIKKL